MFVCIFIFYVNNFTYIPNKLQGNTTVKPRAGALVKTSRFANPCTFSRIKKELKKKKKGYMFKINQHYNRLILWAIVVLICP